MTAVNVLLLVLTIGLLARILPTTRKHAAALILLSGVGLWNCISFGQLYVLLSACVVAGYAMYLREKRVLSGIAFGLLIPVKYYPAVFLLYFALVREWKIVVTALATAAAVTGLSVACLGWEVHRQFLAQVLGSHLASHFSGQTPYATAFQSWDSLLRHLFYADPVENPHPFLASVQLYRWLKAAIAAALLSSTIPLLMNLRRTTEPHFRECAFGLLGILPLLVAPGTATYHFVLFWLPCGLLLHAFWMGGRRKLFSIALALYSVLGFIPYGIFARLGEQWGIWPLAYPRLFVVLGLFLVSLAGAYVMLRDVRERRDDFPEVQPAVTMREA
jgi:hypothetical protein